MGKSTISMAMFNSFVSLPEGIYLHWSHENSTFNQRSLASMSSTSRASYLVGETCFCFGKMGKERLVFAEKMFQDGG